MKYFLLFLFLTSFLFSQENFKSSHQQEWEFYKNNPQEVGKNITPPLLAKRADLMKVQSMHKVVYGFHPYWQNGSESNYYFSMLTHLVYFSADINPATGGFSTTNNWATANVVTLAKQYGVKVHLCLTLFSNHSTLLSSTANKNALIQNTLTQLALRGADGVNIDFESMSATVKTDFRTFMKQFGDTLKARGYEFVIELPAVDWSNIFDATFFSTLNPVTDFYFAMLYDYWWSGSATAGPNSPLRASNITSEWHVLRSIDTYINTKGCPANKFIAGFPNYGREWAVKSTVENADTLGGYTSSSRTYTVVKNNYIDTIPASRQYWSTKYNTRYYNFVNGGVWRQCWYDDSLSWAKKFDSIKVKNVAGTGMWALGYDGTEPELWGALKTAFASTPYPAHTSFDNFETSVGHFDKYPRYSGTTNGIKITSTQAWSNDAANNGWGSMQIVLKDSAEVSTNWTVRILSGGGSRANNVQFSNTSTGYIGFWMKTNSAASGAQVAIAIDDQRNGSTDKTELSSKQNVINDGQWHLYEWKLSASGWTSFSGGNGVLDSATLSLDAIMLYSPNTSSDWTLWIDDVSYNANSSLPVELENFSIFPVQVPISISWSTSSEINNYGFEVERKITPLSPPLQGGDERGGWEKLGFVEGHGTTNIPRNYSFVDYTAKAGTYHYRLRQIDRTGAFRYSSEIVVTLNSVPQTMELMQNFPNPFNPITTIQYSVGMNARSSSNMTDGTKGMPLAASVPTTLKIYDMLGREVATLVNEEQVPGIYSVQFNAQALSSGIYFYTLRAGNFSETKRMMLVK